MDPIQIRKLLKIPDIQELINRERDYVSKRMNGHAKFTDRENRKIEAAWNEAKRNLEE